MGSPASRFGLEEGDYILDVSGYVVGEYKGQYYPLSMAMDYGADANGWADLLVWNKRTFAGLAGEAAGVALAWPEKAEVLGAGVFLFEVLPKDFFEDVPVDFSVGEGLGDNRAELVEAVLIEVKGRVEFVQRHSAVSCSVEVGG